MKALDYNGLARFKNKNDALYAKKDGYYEDLFAGNLLSSVYEEDDAPYIFRTSGGSIDIGNRETDKLVGGTVAWNQAATEVVSDLTILNCTAEVSNHEFTITSTKNNTLEKGARFFTAIEGHKYLFSGEVKTSDTSHSAFIGFYSSSGSGRTRISDNSGSYVKGSKIHSAYSGDVFSFRMANASPSGTYANGKNINCFDLTRMLGSAIADYIYGLETNQAGAGVAWFRKLFPKDYYAYNAGELMSVKTSEHRMVGFNAYDPSTGKAKVVNGNVYQITGTYTSLSLDGTSFTPHADGYFTPSVSGELTVTGGSSADTCVHLKWDGERDGEYEPYVLRSYPLDSSLILRGIPNLDSGNRLYYDGDTYESDGTVTRRYGTRAYASGDESDSTVITDGTNTVYPLVSPTAESAEPYTNPQIVDDWGTEEYVDDRDVPIPVGHITKYQANLRAKLEMAPDSPSDGDGNYLLKQQGGQNTYVKYTDGGRITALEAKVPAAPTADGTYVLKCIVSDGSAAFAWTAAE